jgi:uncharacterized protein (TIGR03118 family)
VKLRRLQPLRFNLLEERLSMKRNAGKLSLAMGAVMALVAVCPVRAQFYKQKNLVSNRTDMGAVVVDPNLQNPWGVSHGPTTPFWVSDQRTDVATLYSVNSATGAVAMVPLVVAISHGATPPHGPTGQVFNSVPTDFVVSSGSGSGSSLFLFSALNGGISGWNAAVPPPPPSHTAITPQFGAPPPAVYTGLALGMRASGQHLYAANPAGGRIDVFTSTFTQVSVPGGFTDPTLPANEAPFNVANINGNLYVSYTGPPGSVGVVNEFDTEGHFIKRFATDGTLSNPWGMVVAPADFGMFANALLVGNFNAGNPANGPGHISAFNLTTGAFLGLLQGTDGAALQIDGLWQLIFGNGVTGASPPTSGGNASVLYFAAGINNQIDGLFGSLSTCHGPVISGASASPNVLWPPNHKSVPVTINYSVADDCDPAPVCTLIVTNDETGANDTTVVNAHTVDLVASREGNGNGRVYTVKISCTDKLPLSSSTSVTVTVPHDQGQ